jgi:hypothetical protein
MKMEELVENALRPKMSKKDLLETINHSWIPENVVADRLRIKFREFSSPRISLLRRDFRTE